MRLHALSIDGCSRYLRLHFLIEDCEIVKSADTVDSDIPEKQKRLIARQRRSSEKVILDCHGSSRGFAVMRPPSSVYIVYCLWRYHTSHTFAVFKWQKPEQYSKRWRFFLYLFIGVVKHHVEQDHWANIVPDK